MPLGRRRHHATRHAAVADHVQGDTGGAQWLDEFYTRLQTKGVIADRKVYDGASRYVSRALDQRVSHFASGDSTAKRRDLAYDAPLRKAIDLLEKGTSQRDLFALAGEPLAAAPARIPKKP